MSNVFFSQITISFIHSFAQSSPHPPPLLFSSSSASSASSLASLAHFPSSHNTLGIQEEVTVWQPIDTMRHPISVHHSRLGGHSPLHLADPKAINYLDLLLVPLHFVFLFHYFRRMYGDVYGDVLHVFLFVSVYLHIFLPFCHPPLLSRLVS